MKIKKVLAGFLAGILLFLTPGGAVYAEESAGTQRKEYTRSVSAEEQEKQEKAASYAEKIETNAISNWPQGPAIYAASGIVMDMNSGAVLYAKKADEQRYPASITKDFECTDGIAVCEDDGYGCIFRRQYLFFAVG